LPLVTCPSASIATVLTVDALHPATTKLFKSITDSPKNTGDQRLLEVAEVYERQMEGARAKVLEVVEIHEWGMEAARTRLLESVLPRAREGSTSSNRSVDAQGENDWHSGMY
jgi:hypothetical protein